MISEEKGNTESIKSGSRKVKKSGRINGKDDIARGHSLYSKSESNFGLLLFCTMLDQLTKVILTISWDLIPISISDQN